VALLSVNNLKVYFHTRNGVVKAVDDISYEVNPGETLGIVGESGSGKSVSCYSLLDLLPKPPAKIEGGTAQFDDQDLLTLSSKKMRNIRGNRISMIFQDPMTCLNPYMKVSQQLMEPLLIHKGLSKGEALQRAVKALDEVGIPEPEKRVHAYPHEFSGGMRQRVMIAMALITEPELLIADEPTTALDVTIQAQILKLIKKLQQEHNIAVIFITHDLGVVADIADKVIVMKKGQIVEHGKTHDIFYHHKHPYTKALLEAIPTTAKPQETINASIEDADSQGFLSLKNLRTYFTTSKKEQIKAVDDISFDVRKGEILGLVGESGSGKSSLGRSIIRLVQTTSGQVTLEGKPLLDLEDKSLKQARTDFQMIFQDPYASLNPRMTVFDTLAEPLLLHGLANKQNLNEKIAELMQDCGLEQKFVRKYPHEFSGGQRQRIAIARALAPNPKLIIADEPVSALDVTIQAQILDLLMKLAKQRNLTMIFISHDLSVVRYITDRTAVMYRGKIVEIGDTETLFANPKHEYTKGLLSAIPLPDPKQSALNKEL
jgi:ABC-type dipeptide/oligopeptide/nickel transport system ATPase component